jgi:penicillin-binding protein 1C
MLNRTSDGSVAGGNRRSGRVRLAAWLAVAAVLALAAVAWLLASSFEQVGPLPSYQDVQSGYRASDVRVLDREGRLLQRVRTDYTGRRGDWLTLSDISPALRNAVVLSEDHRFHAHSGVDWRALAGAAWSDVVRGRHRGASTITMQLAGFIDPGLRRGPSGRTYGQKIRQVFAAMALERKWSKAQILDAYLNLVSFKGELIGVDALSRVMYQKHASGLDARESALAAVLLRAPNASRSVLRRRTCALLKRMGTPRECNGLEDFIDLSLLRTSAPRADLDDLAPQFARWVLTQSPQPAGASFRTSIDASLQRYVLDSVRRHLLALRASNVRDAAVVVLDNATGEILAYVGSSGGLSSARHVDYAQALRQAGSTLKPFLYSQAIGQGRLTAASLLLDGPLDLPTGTGLYIPQNYDKHFTGWVSVRTALASSLNVPAVRTLVMVSPDTFQKRLVALGLPLDRTGDFYGYSLALGSADVTLLSLANAYRALANLGRYAPVRYRPGSGHAATRPDQVIDEGAAWIVGDILSDRHARTRTFGLDSPLTTSFWSAVKTGTSKDMRDNWCIGWSQFYTVGVWVGNSSGDSMRNVSGVSGAGPIWHDVMAHLWRDASSRQPPMPAGVTRQEVAFDGGIEPARSEVFLGDTAMHRVRLSRELIQAGHGMPRIRQPVDGTVLALDPDIPPVNQRAWFQATNLAAEEARKVQWSVDGKIIGQGGEVPWMPWPGRHVVRLLDLDGKTLDSAALEVRGAVPKQSARVVSAAYRSRGERSAHTR